MKSVEDELREIAARQRGSALELLLSIAAGVCLFVLAPAAELGGSELQTVFLCAVAGFGVGLVTFIQRLLEILETSCPRCNEDFYRFPVNLPLFQPQRCASCSQSLSTPDPTRGPTPV